MKEKEFTETIDTKKLLKHCNLKNYNSKEISEAINKITNKEIK